MQVTDEEQKLATVPVPAGPSLECSVLVVDPQSGVLGREGWWGVLWRRQWWLGSSCLHVFSWAVSGDRKLWILCHTCHENMASHLCESTVLVSDGTFSRRCHIRIYSFSPVWIHRCTLNVDSHLQYFAQVSHTWIDRAFFLWKFAVLWFLPVSV